MCIYQLIKRFISQLENNIVCGATHSFFQQAPSRSCFLLSLSINWSVACVSKTPLYTYARHGKNDIITHTREEKENEAEK